MSKEESSKTSASDPVMGRAFYADCPRAGGDQVRIRIEKKVYIVDILTATKIMRDIRNATELALGWRPSEENKDGQS